MITQPAIEPYFLFRLGVESLFDSLTDHFPIFLDPFLDLDLCLHLVFYIGHLDLIRSVSPKFENVIWFQQTDQL